MYGKRGYAKRRYAKKSTARRAPARRRVGRKTGMSGIKKMVNSMIHRNQENKRDYNAGAGTLYAANTFQTVYNQNVVPVIAQTVGQGGRIGNEVTIVKSTLTIHLWPTPYSTPSPLGNSITKPQVVRVMIIKQKQLAVGATAITNQSNFFQLGSVTTDFAGTLVDTSRDVNLDLFTVKYSRVFKVSQAAPQSTASSPGNFQPNNDFKLCQRITIPLAKMMKKKLKYDDQLNTNRCVNDNCFLVMQAVNFDNTGPNANQGQVGFEWEQHSIFEDA